MSLADVDASRLRMRTWGCSLLFPNLDADHSNAVVVLAGAKPFTTPPVAQTRDMQMCRPQRPVGCWPGGYYWTDLDTPTVCSNKLPDMVVARIGSNAVLLPDGSFLVIGGGGVPGSDFTNTIERYDGGQWHACASLLQRVPGVEHGYGFHATAVLLPDGRVLIGAGNDLVWPLQRYDYQIYVPWYIACGTPRPVISQINDGVEGIQYGDTFRVQYVVDPKVAVQKVVLVRPSSVTHGFNSDQRYIELEDVGIEPDPGEIWVKMPSNPPGQGSTLSNPNEVTGPPGFYMLFLVSSGRIPSVAGWVELKL